MELENPLLWVELTEQNLRDLDDEKMILLDYDYYDAVDKEIVVIDHQQFEQLPGDHPPNSDRDVVSLSESARQSLRKHDFGLERVGDWVYVVYMEDEVPSQVTVNWIVADLDADLFEDHKPLFVGDPPNRTDIP